MSRFYILAIDLLLDPSNCIKMSFISRSSTHVLLLINIILNTHIDIKARADHLVYKPTSYDLPMYVFMKSELPPLTLEI